LLPGTAARKKPSWSGRNMAKKTATQATQRLLKVTLVRSVIGTKEAHRATVRGLGLRRMHHTVEVIDSPEVRGMIRSISFLLRVEG